MISTKTNSDLISYDDAFAYLKDKFDTLAGEVEYWLNDDSVGLIYHDVEGNVHSGDHEVAYVDKKIIETLDFEKDYPYWPRIHFSKIEGNLIPEMYAVKIIENKLKEISNVGNHYTIIHLLSNLRGFIQNIPNKNGVLFISNSPFAAMLSLYYEDNEVNKINITNPEYLYIDYNMLMNRPKWKGLNKDRVFLFLIRMNREQRLKAIGYDRYVPCAMDAPEGFTINPYGKKEFFKRTSPTGHYGYDAQKLISSNQSLFQLSEIIAIEEDNFVEPEKEVTAKINTETIVKTLFEQEINKIKNKNKNIPHNKSAMAARIIKADQENGCFLKENIKPSTVGRILSNLKYNNRICDLKKLKS